MILVSSSRPENESNETPLAFAARLWLRTAIAAWLLWLLPLAAVVLHNVAR